MRLVVLLLVALVGGTIAVARAVPRRAWPYIASLGAMCAVVYLLVSSTPPLTGRQLFFAAFVIAFGLGLGVLLRIKRRGGKVPASAPRTHGRGTLRQLSRGSPANAIGLAGLTVPNSAMASAPPSRLNAVTAPSHLAGMSQVPSQGQLNAPKTGGASSSNAKLLRDMELLRARPPQAPADPLRHANPTAPMNVIAPRVASSVAVERGVALTVPKQSTVEPSAPRTTPVSPGPSRDRANLEAALQELRSARMDSRASVPAPKVVNRSLVVDSRVSLPVPSSPPAAPSTPLASPSVSPAAGSSQPTRKSVPPEKTRDALSRLAEALNSRERVRGDAALAPAQEKNEPRFAAVEPVSISVASTPVSPIFRIPEPAIRRPLLQDINVDLAARLAELEARELPSPVRVPQAETRPPPALDMSEVAHIRQEPPTIVGREGADTDPAHQDPVPPIAVQQPTTRPIDVKPKVALGPPRLRPTVDLSRIARLQEESRAVDALLSKIFMDEVRHESASPAAVELPQLQGDAASAVLLNGLDEPHTKFAAIVVSRPKWTREELSELAVANDLMLDGALELINDCAFEAFGEPLTEERASIEVNGDISAQMKAQTFADSQREKTEA